MRVVIIGLGAAGFAAMLSAKKFNRSAEIIVVDKKKFDLLHHCGLPFYIEGRIKNIADLTQNVNLEGMGVKKYPDYEAIKIHGDAKEVEIKKLSTGEHEKIKYDSLIIACGAEAFKPPIKGVEFAYTLDNAENAQKIKEKAKTAKAAVVIGAGAIGLETGYALKELGLNVKIVDILQNALPKLIDKDISEIVENYLKNNGIEMLFNQKINEITHDRVILNDDEVDSDLTILATGVRGNLELAKNSGIHVGKFGIEVNKKMETNLKDVYAAGDCVQAFSEINKAPFACQIATTAYHQGTKAGINAAGGNAAYSGILGTFVSKIGEIEVAATGFNSFFAEQNGYKVIVSKAKSKTKPDWFPGSAEITIKLIANDKGKLIGAQAIGKEGAASRINALSAAIKAGFSFKELAELELAYCPSVSSAVDVITVAAELGLRKIV